MKFNGTYPRMTAIVWYRDDLRISDHPALHAAARTHAPIVCIYVLDDRAPGVRSLGGATRWWLARSLRVLQESLRARGASLVLRQGRAPKIGVLVEVREAYLHCAKAINRAGLWDPSRHIARNDLPSYGDMLVDHCAGLTREESERQGAEMARRGMY